MGYMAITDLAQTIAEAAVIGRASADAQPDDGGPANLDHIIIHGLKGVREQTLRAHGVDCRKRGVGRFSPAAPFAGQGRRRTAGVEAMQAHLKANGVKSFVNHQLD